jgi:BirA family biotin operon repressor/biotin-[acetyl-CoA-carboxylase] ligase
MTSPLSIETIRALCRPAAQQVAIEWVAETGSTNADLLAGLEQLSGPALLLTETQTAGKGRAGRTWHSAPGEALTFSLAWKFSLPAQALLGLPLAVGVAVAEALAQFGVGVRLKWPNDVLLDGKKVAGILIEIAAAKGGAGEQCWAVIGVGINIVVPDSLAALIGRPVAAAPGLQGDRNRVVAALLSNLTDAMLLFEDQGFKAFGARWNALHAYGGEQVAIIDGGQVLHKGIAVGVDDSGRLLMDTLQGRVAVVAGDVSLVSLRPLQSSHAKEG